MVGLLWCSVLIGHGQYWGGGIIVGFSASQIDGDSYGGYKKLGPLLGGFARYEFDEKFSLQPEIVFNQRGAREVTDATFYHVRINYIDVPVLLNYRAWSNGNQSLQLQAGPQFGVLLGATGAVGDRDNKVDISSFYHRFDLNGVAGLDFYVTPNISVNGRFGYSIIRTNKNLTGSGNFGFRSRQVHKFVQFSLRYDLKPVQ